ncbi:AI-2E family transporter [Jannaschia sp. AI_61]|nr:AI-2E family transporter [Jannaschia sp. AI_61]
MHDRKPSVWATSSLVLLACVATGAALEYAQPILAPALAAIVLGVVLAPAMDFLSRLGLGAAAAAFVVLIVFSGLASLLFFAIEPSLSRAVSQAPILWAELEDLLRFLRDAVGGVQELQDSVSEALTDPDGEEASGSSTAMAVPSLFDALSYGPALLAGILVFLGTLFFFLTGRADLYRQISNQIASITSETLRDAEGQVSRYFLTITCINFGFGCCVSLAMAVLGMPEPVLWGVATFLLNFVMYLGPAMIAVALLLGGIVTFDGIMSFVPALVFVGFNMVEAQFVTPALVGRHMSLNPLFVFLSLIFWLWLWGPLGGFVAIPLVVWTLFLVQARRAT